MPNQPSFTADSRFHMHRFHPCFGEYTYTNMYTSNVQVEGDGLGYPEIVPLRSLLLHPLLFVIIGTNMLLALNRKLNGWVVFAHSVGLLANILRIILSVLCLLLELISFPARVLLGWLLTPLALAVGAGHLYAMSCAFAHTVLLDASVLVLRRFTIAPFCNGVVEHETFRAGWLGSVRGYNAKTAPEAAYIAAVLRLQQRTGCGPEAVCVRGNAVFVTDWSAFSISAWLKRGDVKRWKIMDPNTFHWRRTIIRFMSVNEYSEHFWGTQSNLASPQGYTALDIDPADSFQDYRRLAFVHSDEHLGILNDCAHVEDLYESPRGFNKYQWMRAEGSKVVVLRNDRRALGHCIALIIALGAFLLLRNPSANGAPPPHTVELYAFVLGLYAVVAGYAAEVVTGPQRHKVDAKSERYGAMVTRAIDWGFVRGFHVPGGEWLGYRNGGEQLPWHEVTRNDVNMTCNSVVRGAPGSGIVHVMAYMRAGRQVGLVPFLPDVV